MKETSYNIIFRGEIAEGQDVNKVKKNFGALFKVNDEKIDLLFSGRPVNIKKNIDHSTAIKYREAIEKAGARCAIEPVTGKTETKPPHESEEQKESAQPPAAIEPETTRTSIPALQHTVKVISTERIKRDVTYSPKQCPSISASEKGLNFHRPDCREVLFDSIRLVSVFAEEALVGREFRLVMFLKNSKRPYISNGDNIRFPDFPGVKDEGLISSLRNFVLFLCNKNHDLIIDERTYNYIKGDDLNLLVIEPLDVITSLGKALGE